MNSQKTSLIALCGTLGLFAGCATEPESHVVSAPPPASPTSPQQVVVTQQPQQVVVTQPQQQVVTTVPVSGTSYVVMQAPPAPQPPQAIPTQPSSHHVWIDGYWTWQNNRYEWMAGHWEVPPFAGARWHSPHVESDSGAFRFYEGYWN